MELRNFFPLRISKLLWKNKCGRKEKKRSHLRARSKDGSHSEAEGLKQSAILRAEATREAAIREAEGIRQAKILQAEGEAQQFVGAKAVAESLVMIRESAPDQKVLSLKALETLKTMVKDRQPS